MTLVLDVLSERRPPRDAPGTGPSPRSSPPSLSGGGGTPPPLYRKREPIHPKQVHGPFRALKWGLLVFLLGVYYAVPWIRWDRPGDLPDQAAMVDFAHGRFYFFGLQLWAQEVYYVTGLLVAAALSLFLVTALFGRLWCGYACPQTVWTDLYIAVERLFEGDRNARLRLDKAPWRAGKIARKIGKHLVWIVIAAATGGAWVFYFQDAPTLWRDLWSGRAETTSYVSVGLLTATTYYFAGWMREQVCTYMCPWPRIQGAMLDPHSLQVTYRYDRGEPRGPHKKGEAWTGRGDCVDCKACVAACPTGIDIRNGPQLECINCGLCIDACDEMMVRLERPKGLIGYDTDAAVAARACGNDATYRPVRGRTVYYAAGLLVVGSLMTYGLANRATVHLDVLRDRNPIFVRLKDGSIRNGYTLKLSNKADAPRDLVLRFAGPKGALVSPVGLPQGVETAVRLKADEVRSVRVLVAARPEALGLESLPASFTLLDPKTGETDRVGTVFRSGHAR